MIPQTGFEASGESIYTNRSDEEIFLRTLDRETRATLTVEGRSVLGSPMWCITIGEGSTIMVVSNVHPREPAGRDAALSWFRDIAYSTDPQVVKYLEDHKIVLMPNVNIDGSSRPRLRENVNGVNLNRDYIALREPESRAVANVALKNEPTLIMDMHQVGDDQGAAWRPYWEAPHGGHASLLELGREYVENTAEVLLKDDYTTLNYGSTVVPWGGLSTIAPAWHAVGILNEVAYLPGGAAENVAVARITLDYLYEFHRENSARLDAARTSSKEDRSTEPIRVPSGQWLNRGDHTLVPGDRVARISGDVPVELFRLHGIEYDGQDVPFNQAASLMAAYIVSPESSEHIPNNEQWSPSPEGEPATSVTPNDKDTGWVKEGDAFRVIRERFVKYGGSLRPVSQSLTKRGGTLYPLGPQIQKRYFL